MPGVWALGDCAAVPNAAADGATDPATCQHALRQARQLARNLHGTPQPYRYRTRGQMATLGRRHGVAVAGGLPVRGLAGWALARGYHLLALPFVSRRARVLADWASAAVFRRDVSARGTSPPPALIDSRRPMFAQTYPSLEAFYAADFRRRHSKERDLGLLWRDRGEAAFRAAWVQGTGEVYLFMYAQIDGSGGTVDVLDRRFTLRRSCAPSPATATTAASQARCNGSSTAPAQRARSRRRRDAAPSGNLRQHLRCGDHAVSRHIHLALRNEGRATMSPQPVRVNGLRSIDTIVVRRSKERPLSRSGRYSESSIQQP